MRILLVEDDKMIGEAVREHLISGGNAVDWVRNLADAEAAARSVHYAVVLLDLQLPDGSGIDFLKQLRSNQDAAPVIILTARDQISDRIDGLNAGADDYLVKPFNLGELEARINAVSRRSGATPQPIVKMGTLEIDRSSHRVLVDGAPAELTGREWAVLDLLLVRPGAVVPKERIEEALYAFGSEIESNTVEVYVSRLRKKIGKERIKTARGLGYTLEEK
ncbi:response regulator [Oryzifoliimicrobium ureilyticus]|uniref:response regulator n=1 Tax=Oryzifoliimicrobium ureilyticus TaxID=3113724 RepID=UPI003075FA05